MTDRARNSSTAAPLDVLEIDRYLGCLLVPRINLMLNPVGFHLPATVTTALLHLATLWLMSGDSPAGVALGLKVRGSSSRSLLVYSLLTAALPLTYQRLVEWHDQALGRVEEANQMNAVQFNALHRKMLVTNKIIHTLKRSIPLLNLIVLLTWWAGKAPSPTASMMAAGITYTRLAPTQELNVSYAHRRWVYDLILRSIQLVSPVQSFDDVKMIVNSMVRPLRLLVTWRMRREVNQQCALCNGYPVVIPCYTRCKHLYCYTCLWTALARNTGFICKQCGEPITEIRR